MKSTKMFFLSLGFIAFTQVPTSLANSYNNQQSYSVSVNKTQLIRLPQAAGAIIVGNPNIADVSIHSSDTLFILGRGFGETNMIILNGAGETILNADIQVSSDISNSGRRIITGSDDTRTYSCSPHCHPAPILGDRPEFTVNNSPQDTQGIQRNNTANPAFGGSAPQGGASLGGANPGGANPGGASLGGASSQSFGSGSEFE